MKIEVTNITCEMSRKEYCVQHVLGADFDDILVYLMGKVVKKWEMIYMFTIESLLLTEEMCK